MTDLNKLFGSIGDLYSSPRELGAIWLTQPVATNEGKTVRIAPGMQIHYENDCISLNAETFNKEILTCYGTLVNQFRIKVKDLDTGIESMITL